MRYVPPDGNCGVEAHRRACTQVRSRSLDIGSTRISDSAIVKILKRRAYSKCLDHAVPGWRDLVETWS